MARTALFDFLQGATPGVTPTFEELFGLTRQSLLFPEWPRMDEARGLLREYPVRPGEGTKAAWEAAAVRGLIPDGWVEHPTRRFLARSDAAGISIVHTAPPTRAAFLAMAAGAQDVARAEAFAEAAHHAADLWRTPQRITHIRWWVGRAPRGAEGHALTAPLHCVKRSVRQRVREEAQRIAETFLTRLRAEGRPLTCAPKVWDAQRFRLRPAVEGALCWRAATEFGDLVRCEKGLDGAALNGTAFNDLPNPFLPDLGVWKTGFGFGEDTYGALSLLAPLWLL